MSPPIRLGVRENLAQFSLLVLVNAFVGAMINDRNDEVRALCGGTLAWQRHAAIGQ